MINRMQKMKKKNQLRLKLKFVKYKCCFGTCISSINYASLLVKVQIKHDLPVTDINLVSFFNFEQI